jgi:hypothetical protein
VVTLQRSLVTSRRRPLQLLVERSQPVVEFAAFGGEVGETFPIVGDGVVGEFGFD